MEGANRLKRDTFVPLTTQELLEKAKDQRKRKRYDEALVSARAAAIADPDDADTWWHVGLNLTSLGRGEEAADAYEKAVELAPWFSSGWERLGYALETSRKFDEARVALERALVEGADEGDEIDILEGLARIYPQLSSTAQEHTDREIEVLHRVEELSYLDAVQLNRLGILHYNGKRFFEAIKYWEQAVAGDSAAQTSRFNLGLAYNDPEVSQDADAIDMWRLTLDADPGYARATERITAILPRLLELAERARAAGETLLPQDQWYAHYLNPFELLNVIEENDLGDISEGFLEPKTLQRLRRRLLQEIELEDGTLSWMGGGLVVDRSRAISVCDELGSEDIARYHWIVFMNDPLLDFLSKGCHEHFLVNVGASPLDVIGELESDEGFRQWLGNRFWPQYSRVLCKAIDLRSLSAIEVLFDGRRWIPPERTDQCFEAARRLVHGLLEPLRQLGAKHKATLPAISEALLHRNLASVLNLLPAQFRGLQSEAAALVRGMAAESYKQNGDADQALKILELTKRLHFKSAKLNAGLDDDFAQVRKLIEEERKNEVKVNFGSVASSITKEGVKHGEAYLPISEIAAVGWGAKSSRNALGTITTDYMMRFRSGSGQEIRFGWRSDKALESWKFCEELFPRMLDAAFSYVVPAVSLRLWQSLEAGRTEVIGPCTVSRMGIGFKTSGWLLSKDNFIAWNKVVLIIQNGDVLVSNSQHLGTRTSMSLWDVYNAPLLKYLQMMMEKEK